MKRLIHFLKNLRNNKMNGIIIKKLQKCFLNKLLKEMIFKNNFIILIKIIFKKI
jgi:hypothetical protein